MSIPAWLQELKDTESTYDKMDPNDLGHYKAFVKCEELAWQNLPRLIRIAEAAHKLVSVSYDPPFSRQVKDAEEVRAALRGDEEQGR